MLDRPQRAFLYADYGVPDQHTIFLGGNGTWLTDNSETATAFIHAAQRGYAFAASNPDEAADILIAETAGMLTNPDLVRASMQALVSGGYRPIHSRTFQLIAETLNFSYWVLDC